MKRGMFLWIAVVISLGTSAQQFKATEADTSANAVFDTTIVFKDIDYAVFRNPDDQMEYYKDISRIRIVLPYVKIAKRLYADIRDKKETERRRDYRHYRRDVEKEMRGKFEKELKNLTIGQGKVLVKLINRETGNNCYGIIKDVKGGFSAWTWQIVARHYDYDLKEQYDKKKEWILELAIRSLGQEYDPN